jgi:hypothetical protein
MRNIFIATNKMSCRDRTSEPHKNPAPAHPGSADPCSDTSSMSPRFWRRSPRRRCTGRKELRGQRGDGRISHPIRRVGGDRGSGKVFRSDPLQGVGQVDGINVQSITLWFLQFRGGSRGKCGNVDRIRKLHYYEHPGQTGGVFAAARRDGIQ